MFPKMHEIVKPGKIGVAVIARLDGYLFVYLLEDVKNAGKCENVMTFHRVH